MVEQSADHFAGRLQAVRTLLLLDQVDRCSPTVKWNTGSTSSPGDLPQEWIAIASIAEPPQGLQPDRCAALQLEYHQRGTLSFTQALKKLDTEIDPETKNMVINGDRPHLAMVLRQLQELYEREDDGQGMEDSLDVAEPKRELKKESKLVREQSEAMRESLSLSKSEEQPALQPFGKKNSEQLAAL